MNDHNLPDDLPIPQAKPAFKQQLEDNLISLMSAKGDAPMTTALPMHPRRFSPPLTLAAAILVVILMLNMAILMRNAPPVFQTGAPPVSGCDTPYAQIQAPTNGESISQSVTVIGIAAGSYTLQMDNENTEPRRVYGSDTPVTETGFLGVINPDRFESGTYQLRLDVTGANPATCTITVSIELPQMPVGTPFPMVRIVAAKRFIASGQMISAEDVEYVQWKEEQTPLSAMIEIDEVIGKYAKTDIYRASPILGNIIDTASSVPLPDYSLASDVVVIAVQPISKGQIITEEMVALRDWPEFAIPPRSFRNVNEVIGHTAMTDIYREQPLNLMMVSDDAVPVPSEMILPSGTRLISIPPLDALSSAQYAIQPGDRVDVYVESGRLAQNALVVYIGNVQPDGQAASVPDMDVISLAVTPEEATALTAAIDSEQPFTFVLIENPESGARKPITIPTELLKSSTIEMLKVGDQVHIIAALLYVDVDEEFQSTDPTTSTPRVTLQHVSADAVITAIDENGVTVSVLPEQAVMLSYLMESKSPIMLIPQH